MGSKNPSKTKFAGARGSLLAVVAISIATLYFAQEVLIPLALSFLLTFLLAPLATRLERRGLKRVPSVLVVVGLAFVGIFAMGWTVGRQVVKLADDVDNYKEEIIRKAHRLAGTGASMGSKFGKLGDEFEKATNVPSTQPTTAPTTQVGLVSATKEQFDKDPIKGTVRELAGVSAATQPAPLGSTPSNPVFSVSLPAPVSPIKTLGTYLGLALGPLGTAGLVIVFVVFMLLEREDLRDRLLSLISRGKYTVTTRALNDAGKRISKYMLAQSIVNGSYGLIIGIGLWIIGATMGHGTSFPSFVLWALLCAVLRFIPYIGPFLASSFPIALSLAVYPGFSVFIAVLALFVVIELISNNVMEPWLYGSSTGMSTMAILVAAVFWTWLWGPVGLLLSTPLTVCMVVLGKHVPQLHFLYVLLGDQPALPSSVRYYQRLLAGDKMEAAAIVGKCVAEVGADHVPDEVIVPALSLARRDREDEELSAEKETQVLSATSDIIAEVLVPKPTETPKTESSARSLVLMYPSHHRVEELALELVAGTLSTVKGLQMEVASTRLLSSEIESRIERDRPAVFVVAVLPPGGLVQARYLCRRLKRRFRDLKIIVAYLGKTRNFDRLLVRLRSSGANYVTTSILQTRSQVLALLSANADETLLRAASAANPSNDAAIPDSNVAPAGALIP